MFILSGQSAITSGYTRGVGVHHSFFDLEQPFLWTVPGVLSDNECADLIGRARAGEWLPATVNSTTGRTVRQSVRFHDLVLLDDPALARALRERLGPHLPPRMSGRPLTTIKERLRVYRYLRGQFFGLHRDQKYLGPGGQQSQLTVLIYLNDDFTGGETPFPELKQTVHPARGTAVIFQNAVLHAGNRVDDGTKYLLRADVFYGPKQP